MKQNLPVTGVEQEVHEDAVILSTTDLKGRITYANQAFVDISGFEEGELVNHSHNVVRHPDMPPSLFADLWQTIQAGRSWMGLIKNRCKNGDHYWVNALVTPVMRDGEIIEYQSVRTRASRDDIARAERIYARLNKGLNSGKHPMPAWWVRGMPLLLGLVGAIPGAVLSLAASNIDYSLSVPLLVIAVALMLSGLWWWSRPQQRSAQIARDVIDSPLLQQVYAGSRHADGAVKLAIKLLKTQINALAGRVHDSAMHIETGARDMSNSVALTTQGLQHQKSEIDQLTGAVQELVNTTEHVSRNAQQASEAANEADENACNGAQLVNETIQIMHALASQVEDSSEAMHQLAENTNNISTILDVIKTVAEQTNLLALNAAIEAARAGEQGRGFAVVADEVRSLASRTQDSTQEIETMIQHLQAASNSAVNAMHGGRDMAQNSVQQVTAAGEALSSITAAMRKIKDMNTSIASAAEEQNNVTHTVKSNVENISDVTELTMETLDSIRQTSEDIERSSHVFDDLRQHFSQRFNS